MKKTTIAYIAGLIDGEGNIMVKVRKPTIKKYKNPQIFPSVRVGMSDKKTIEWIHKQFEFGSFFITKRKNKNNKWNDLYHWEVTYQKALKVLRMIQPYLITKREICDKILLELLVRRSP